ncbi:MAG: hypothetical protein JKY03_13840 [Aureispira sp.]|nr:hypothetical protein [Aureispira sp.]
MNRHLLLGVLLLILCYSTTTISQNENKSQLVQGLVLDDFTKQPKKNRVVGLLSHSPEIIRVFNSDGSFTIEKILLLVVRERIFLIIT